VIDLLSSPHAIYRLRDAAGELLYIGVTSDAALRLLQLARYAPFASEIASCSIDHYDTRADAESAEHAAITTEAARYNRRAATTKRRAHPDGAAHGHTGEIAWYLWLQLDPELAAWVHDQATQAGQSDAAFIRAAPESARRTPRQTLPRMVEYKYRSAGGVPAGRDDGRGDMATEHYTLSDERAARIAALAGLTVEQVREFALADWDEGAEHQEWLDTADEREIADWIIAGREA
jgi:hypothetical protein